MSGYVTDTHPLIWHMFGDRRLSAAAANVFSGADSGLHQILIPSIVLVEVVYLAERNRIDPTTLDKVLSMLDMASRNYEVALLDIGVVQKLREMDSTRVPEMPDRIIVATAAHRGLNLLTRDRAIASPGLVGTVW